MKNYFCKFSKKSEKQKKEKSIREWPLPEEAGLVEPIGAGASEGLPAETDEEQRVSEEETLEQGTAASWDCPPTGPKVVATSLSR